MLRILISLCLLTPMVSLAESVSATEDVSVAEDSRLAHGVRLNLSSCLDGAGELSGESFDYKSTSFCENPARYFVSEKLDGVRGYWDGHNLYTRNGNLIRAPEQFTKGWPSVPLDGELWMGRGRFDEVSGIVRRKIPESGVWQKVRFMVFDLHITDVPFEERLLKARELLHRANNPSIELVPQRSVASLPEIKEMLKSVVSQGGEGLMLHRKGALYMAGRSNDILKLKPLWDAEALVVAHLPGKGKFTNMMGSLLVEGLSDTRNHGRWFKIGTGFTEQQRMTPPAVGSVITYQFRGYTSTGLPRFASFLRVRGE